VQTADVREQLQAGLGSQYTLERELGRGGMATVYLARDAKHQRFVALKVLHADLAASLGPERFRREITTAAQLQHPHILGVFDSGETPTGQLWFTMPYVEGESLRDRLRRERQLPIDDAIRIARELAGALVFAHSHGVVHRDIKPENVLLTVQGDALLGDFGIARALQGASDGNVLTETGFLVGTPQYMSPEQAAGDPTLGPQSDVYSLGAVLYEMLAGEPPFVGGSAQAVVAKILTSDAPSVRARRPEVTPALDDTVARALARVRADRFASSHELAQALATVERTGGTTAGGRIAARHTRRRLALGAVAGAVALVAVVLWQRRTRPPVPGAAEASVLGLAVLPFDTEGDTADAYFADGITDEIRGKLSGLPALRLIASASSNQYRRSTKPENQIANELGVRYLLTGRVQWEHGVNGVRRVRVRPELVEVRAGVQPAIRWQSSYDTTLADVFDVQAAVATRVAEHLGIVLSPPALAGLDARPTQNLAAYDAYLHGASYVGIDPATLRRALREAERAVALDSNYARAWAQLSIIHTKLFVVAQPTRIEGDAAGRAAERAVALAPTDPSGYIARGYYAVHVTKDRAAARAAYDTALRLKPSSSEATQALMGAEAAAGDWSAALEHARRAVALDPRSSVAARDLSWVLLWLRRYPEARDATDHALALVPTDLDMIEQRAISWLGQGDLAHARDGLRDVPSTLDRASLVAYVSNYWDLYWVLDSADQELALGLPSHAFDDDKATWAIMRSQLYGLRNDTIRSRQYADSARAVEDARVTGPDDFQRDLVRGLALARLGQSRAAEAAGERAQTVAVATGDNFGVMAYAHHVLARIYVTTGNHAKALDQLDSLLAKPYFISAAWLRIDPAWAPLAGEPRFQRLVATAARPARP
jgi:eukaryotic-like serine/threonine-protein kinase